MGSGLGFFSRGAGGGSRRSFRLLRQRLRAFCIVAVLAAAACAAGISLWKNGSFSNMADAAGAQALAVTARMGFVIDDIRVTGTEHMTRDDVLMKLGVRRGAPVFALDLARARENLLKVSWIRDAALSRRLPGRIVVNVTERVPLALWRQEGKTTLIDADGVALEGDADEWKDLPAVTGADAPANAAALLALLGAEPALAAQTEFAARVGGRRWDLHLKNGVVVMLPEKDAGLALARLARAAAREGLLARNILRVDLRLPDRLVVAPGARAEKKDKESI
jgi:cell division protein FtsQ